MKKFPKVWWLLPLILFLVIKAFMMSMFISGIIKGNVAEAVGIAEDRVDVSGLNVTMDGFASEADAAAAEEIARDDVAWTANVEALVNADESSDRETSGEALAATAVSVAVGSGEVVLSGNVADEATRTALLEAAQSEYEPDFTVVDELTVDANAVDPAEGEVVVTGEAPDADTQAAWLSQAEGVANAAGLTVVDETTLAEGDTPTTEPAAEEAVDELNRLFELEPIEFDTAQATIRPESQATLDEAAVVINNNPDAGTLKVVGHTDSDGPDEANLALSQARAQAVVDYLVSTGSVDPERLESEGRGESELKVSPESSTEDKQRNRRIEWELV